MIDRAFWQGKKVLVTGHTGFKGAWLCTWLRQIGASVSGFALPPESDEALFSRTQLSSRMSSTFGDILDLERFCACVRDADPHIIFHLAAQSLVRVGYEEPVRTYATNVLGTAHVFEAVRRVGGVRVIVNITSDKCYDNVGWPWPYRETDSLGGADPYSNSKACAELLTIAWRKAFFGRETGGVSIATGRAGNVIGGGDWARDRIVPDCVRALRRGMPIVLRSPSAVRPWQHVLEPLYGYLLLCEKLWSAGSLYTEGWNFGPAQNAEPLTVQDLAGRIIKLWGNTTTKITVHEASVPEAHYLTIDSSKARARLGWSTKLSVEDALRWTVEWYKCDHREGDVVELLEHQIGQYMH